METKRRIILRTETFERISLRQTSKNMQSQTFHLGNYKVEISQAEQTIFEAEISGFIEIKENKNEIQLKIQKTE